MTLSGSTLSGNSATDDAGGIFNNISGTVTISGSTLSGDSAYWGAGAIYNCDSGTVSIGTSTLSGNAAAHDAGGAIYNYDTGTVTINTSYLSGNSASTNGGAIYNRGTLALTNSTVAYNSASVGGGIATGGGATLTNVTIFGNWASLGGGIATDGGMATLNNAIVADSMSGGDIYIVSGGVSGSNNLVDDATNSGGLTNGVNGNLVGVKPLLALSGNYGGPTQTMALLPGSPAIGAGNPALAVDAQGNPLTTDQRGMGFARTLNGMVDIGAFEDQVSGTAPGSQNAFQGVSGSFTLGSFSDQATTAASWSVDVNWGDGSTDTTFSTTSQGSFGNASRTYDTAGPEIVTVTVSDNYGDVGQYSFSVNVQPALASIAVTPANPSIANGLTQQFTATGTYSNGTTNDLTNLVTWASATPSVATISSTGLAQSLATGTTNITAAYDGVTSPTDTLTVTTSTPPATATFNGKDTTTEGSWIGVYGSQGYNVINATNGVDYPSYATVTPAGNTPYTWAASTNVLQALQNPSGSGRIAAAWYASTSFTVDVDLTDGQSHDIELYLLDYDTTSRSEQIVLTDANTDAVLSTQTVSSFHAGVYMNYTISGNVLITITKTGGANAVLSGLFFDPIAPCPPPPASARRSTRRPPASR